MDTRLDNDIRALLEFIGIIPYHMGFRFLYLSIKLCVKQENEQSSIKLFNQVGKKCKCQCSSVERDMRLELKQAYEKGKLHNLDKLFDAKIVFDYITLTNFLCIATEYLRIYKNHNYF